MQPNIIGITGLAGAGKDTIAKFFIDQGYVQYSLASPIKSALNVMFGWTMDQWDDRDWKERVLPELGKSPRQMAQTLGTDWGRECVNPELWLLLARRFVESSTCPVVISDVRFDNEAALIKELGGEVIRVVRPNTAAVAAHASERGVDTSLVDWVVLNSGTIGDMYARLARVYPAAPVYEDEPEYALSNYPGMTNYTLPAMVEEWLWGTTEQRQLVAVKYGLPYSTMSNYIQRYKAEVRNGRPHHPAR